jgi:DNA-binding CsgD family transcriptional regulator
MAPEHAGGLTRASEGELARTALRVSASRSVQELGDAYALGVRDLIGSRSVGLYALFDRHPRLLVAREAAAGFLDAYAERSQNGDLLIERMLGKGCTIDGATELGDDVWMASGSFSLLNRWGYAHCMCGPLLVGDRVIGVAYTAWAGPAPYAEQARARFDVLCEAGSLALQSLLGSGMAAQGRPCVREGLSPRIREVACLVLRGRSNKEIARELGLSVHTVKEYVGNLCRRVGAQNRTELANRLACGDSATCSHRAECAAN